MNTLTKSDMADHLHFVLGLSKKEAKKLIEVFFEEVSSVLERHEPVKLAGFGRFDLRSKKARPGRNPKTGKEVIITPRLVVSFNPGKKLRSSVLNYAGKIEQD